MEKNSYYVIFVRERFFDIDCSIFIRPTISSIHQLRKSLLYNFGSGLLILSCGPVSDRSKLNGNLKDLESEVSKTLNSKRGYLFKEGGEVSKTLNSNGRYLFKEEGLLHLLSKYFKREVCYAGESKEGYT